MAASKLPGSISGSARSLAPKRALKTTLEVGDPVRCRNNEMMAWEFGTIAQVKPTLKILPDSGVMKNIPTDYKQVEPHPLPKLADQVKAMPDKAFKGVYAPGDIGLIVEIGEKILVTWQSTGKTSAMTKDAWMYWFTVIGTVKPIPDYGDRLRVLPEVAFEGYYREGDLGTVVGVDDKLIWITWERTGQMSTMTRELWMRNFYPEPGGSSEAESGAACDASDAAIVTASVRGTKAVDDDSSDDGFAA